MGITLLSSTKMKLFSACIALAAAKKRSFQNQPDELLYSNEASFITGDFMPDKFPVTSEANFKEQLDDHQEFAVEYFENEYQEHPKKGAQYIKMYNKISSMVEKSVEKCTDWENFVAPEVNANGAAFRRRRAQSGIKPLTGTMTNLAHIVRQLVIPDFVDEDDNSSKKCFKNGFKLLKKLDRQRHHTLFNYCKLIDREAAPCWWAYEANDGKPWRNNEHDSFNWDIFTSSFVGTSRVDRICSGDDKKYADNKVSCPIGKINVTTAWYGRRNSKFCKGDETALDICTGVGSVKNLKDKVGLECNGKSECTLEASDEYAGGDPCPGSSKYLQVIYECNEE